MLYFSNTFFRVSISRGLQNSFSPRRSVTTTVFFSEPDANAFSQVDKHSRQIASFCRPVSRIPRWIKSARVYADRYRWKKAPCFCFFFLIHHLFIFKFFSEVVNNDNRFGLSGCKHPVYHRDGERRPFFKSQAHSLFIFYRWWYFFLSFNGVNLKMCQYTLYTLPMCRRYSFMRRMPDLFRIFIL